MKTRPILISTCLLVSIGCGKSSSSDESTPPPVTSQDAAGTAVTAPDAPTVTVAPASPISVESQTALKLNSSTFYEFQRLQYDCGDIKVAIPDSQVNPFLQGASNFVSLAASSPKRDQALVKTTIVANGETCTHRSLFSVNPAFTQVTYQESQALNDASTPACAAEKSIADGAWSKAITPFDYDIRNTPWVALHIPADLQTKAICPGGTLRAVFAAIVD